MIKRWFGDVFIEVDPVAGHCFIEAPCPGPVRPVRRRERWNTLEDIIAAHQVQMGRCDRSIPHSRHIAQALKFAGEAIKNHQHQKSGEE